MKLNFCPNCAAPLHKETDTKYVCDNGHVYWNNPKATATVILLRDKQALFSKRAIEPRKDTYDFPGGFIEYGENAFKAVERELQEETGLMLNEATLIDSSAQLYEANVSVCDFIFVSRSWTGTPKAADDVAALEWKPLEFIESPAFAWDYSGLVAKLQEFLKN